ncbi:MAG: LuxR C-terminal-related transcriptional regulator, partial [Coriobacteriales bacterium]|nr:LuxR C-terminal-related transcriptional regulator [Coriobacteriales bacterium]
MAGHKGESRPSIPLTGLEDQNILRRVRLDDLLDRALLRPLTSVVAGPGYGKSTALYSYLRAKGIRTVWVQLSSQDNMASHFWETFQCAIAPLNHDLAKSMLAMGFPASEEMQANLARMLRNEFKPRYRYVVVFDDLHLLKDGPVLELISHFVESLSPGISAVTLSRFDNLPNTYEMVRKKLLSRIDEGEFAFTKSEIQEYFELMGVASCADLASDIYHDTEGMPFAVSLAAHLLERSPKDSAYLRLALRGNINRLIDEQVFSVVSEDLQKFLVMLSLVRHLSPEMIAELKGGQEAMDELMLTGSLIRYDHYMHVYHLHHLLLQYLEDKRDLLTEQERQEVHQKAACWCERNGYRIDAISYYQMLGDYDAIIRVAYTYPLVMPFDVAEVLLEIFKQAPDEFFEGNPGARALHPRLIMTLGRVEEAIDLIHEYLTLLEGRPLDAGTCRTLMGLHNTLGFAKMAICPETHDYDFARHFKDALVYFDRASRPPVGGRMLYNIGPFALLVGRGRKGEPEACIEAVRQATACTAITFRGCMVGLDGLMSAEYAYFRGLSTEAENHALHCIGDAQAYDQYEIVGRALYLLLRIYLQTGKYEQAMDVLSQFEELIRQPTFANRYLLHDIATSWFFAMIGEVGQVENWLKSDLWSSGLNQLIGGVEDFAKLRYYLAIKDYETLLAFAENRSTHFGIMRFYVGQVGLTVTKAIAHLRLGNRAEAFAHLKEAYDRARPCDLVMPFVEFGNNMRGLATAALKDSAPGLPTAWLTTIRSKATTYAKRVAFVRSRYLEGRDPDASIQLTNKEVEVLRDLSQGLSRAEISLAHGISINTVKTMLQMIYDKLGAESAMDAIRIA